MPCRDQVEKDPGGDPGEPVETPQLFVTNDEAEDVTSGGRQVIFSVYATPAVQTLDITFAYATGNGTALAGTHYTSRSGTGTIPVGESGVDIAVTVLEPNSAAGTTKTFTLDIASPVHATITDNSGTGTIVYPTDGGGGGGGTPNWKKKVYSSVSPSNVPVYDQFRSYNNVTGPDHNDPDCISADSAGCTGYSAALMMSILEYKRRNLSRVGFRARKILTDSGFTVGGSTWYDSIVFKQLVLGVGGSTAGALTCDGVRRVLQQVPELDDHISVGNTNERWADLKLRIKKRIVTNHCVSMSSSFYKHWDTTGVEPYLYLPRPADWGRYEGTSGSLPHGHSWILTGWNDDVTVKGHPIGGAFRIQSSHGTPWGDGGRAWLPYTYILQSYPGGSNPRKRTSSQGYPWFRFFYPVW
jgi:hypothetical protein